MFAVSRDFEPLTFQADLIVGQTVRTRARGNNQILRVDEADGAGL